jgi:DNA primase
MSATDIVEVIGKTVLLKKRGKNYLGLCPFHSEKSPSFNVDPVKQYFHCFGCKQSGDAISFVMKRDNLGFMDALRQLGDAAGIPMPQRGASSEKTGQRKQLLDANSAASLFFEKLLTNPATGAAGQAYLKQRGFRPETVRQFHIGLAADSWDALLKSPVMKAFPPQLLALAGLAKPRERDGSISGYYDTFRNRLMFPIRDPNGQVIAFGGRVMPGSQDPAKYLNSPETPLFSKSRSIFGLDLARQKIVESRTVAVVEGYTDVVMAHQFGATNVVSPLGTSLTQQHVQILRRFADRIVLLFDSDSAGDTAVNRAVELFLSQPVEIAIASMPDGVDPDEFLLAHGLPAFEALLQNAQDALSYKWKQLVRQFNANGDDMTGQTKAVQQYMEVLAGARGSGSVDSLRWGQALARVSRLTEIAVEDLNRRFGQKKKSKAKPVVQSAVGPAALDENGQSVSTPDADHSSRPKQTGPLNATDRSERWILAILLAEPSRWSHVQLYVSPQQFSDENRRRIAEIYWNHQTDEGEPVFSEFLSNLMEPELAELAVSLIEEFDTLYDPVQRLDEAIGFLAEQRKREEAPKLLAVLRRNNGPAPEISPETSGGSQPTDDPLRLLQEKARRPDLRRVGS